MKRLMTIAVIALGFMGLGLQATEAELLAKVIDLGQKTATIETLLGSDAPEKQKEESGKEFMKSYFILGAGVAGTQPSKYSTEFLNLTQILGLSGHMLLQRKD